LQQLGDKQVEEPPFAPDVAVQIRSPSDDTSLLQRKIELYLQCGSLLVLDVDPLSKTVAAYDSQRRCRFSESDRFAHPVVPWLAFDVGTIFPRSHLAASR
jgi:Uma2 family endonuclease